MSGTDEHVESATNDLTGSFGLRQKETGRSKRSCPP